MKCEDKKAYDYYLDAGVVVNYFRRNNKKLSIYLCECGKFHLTSTINKNKKRKFNRKDYKNMGIYQGSCNQQNEQCVGDIISRKKNGPRICEFHYRENNNEY